MTTSPLSAALNALKTVADELLTDNPVAKTVLDQAFVVVSDKVRASSEDAAKSSTPEGPSDSDNRRIGDALLAYRAQVGMPAEELSDRTGIAIDRIVAIERGSAAMSLVELVRIAGALDIDPKELVEVPVEDERNRLLERVSVLGDKLAATRAEMAEVLAALKALDAKDA